MQLCPSTVDSDKLWTSSLKTSNALEVARVALDFAAVNSQLDAPGAGLSLLDQVRQNKYTLIYSISGDHWISIILHATTVGRLTTIEHAVIAEPTRSPSLIIFLWNRLKEIFSASRGFAFAQPGPQDLWFPSQNDANSCGLRTYSILKTIMSRINDEYIRDPKGSLYDDNSKCCL